MKNNSVQDLDLDLSGAEGDRPERPVPSPLDWALLLLRAPLRRKVLFTAVLVAGIAAVVVFYRLKTPIYRVEAKILAQQHMLPSSFRMNADESNVRTAWELIHRRDNLLALLENAKMLEAPPPSALDELLIEYGLKTRTDPLDNLVNLLDRRLLVITEEGTITIALDWGDPERAYTIVEGALQNFIEARHVQEVTAIDEVISVLRMRAASAREQLEVVTREVRREASGAYREEPVTAAGAAAPANEGVSPELIRLRSLLESKERAIQDVEEFRRRRLADLHIQLDEKLTTYSEAHPSIIQLRQDIDALAKESPQLIALENEAAKLREEYQVRLAQDTTASAAATSAAHSRSSTRTRAPALIEDDERVRDARFQYQQIVERVNAAQLELDAVRAAFKYRYNVVWPPQIPREPFSPKPLKIFGMGIAVAVAFAFLMAALPDVRSGRIVERWQVERGLGITVLGEIDKKSSQQRTSTGGRAGRA